MNNAQLLNFCTWLEDTDLSQAIQVNDWIVPLVQIIHIFAVCAVGTTLLLVGMKIFDRFMVEKSLNQTIVRFQAVITPALIVLLLTGSVLIIGEPSRSLANWVFQVKMILLLSAIAIFFWIKKISGNENRKDQYSSSAITSNQKILASLLLINLVLIIFAGRWIAYT
jgi:putative copper export protein